MLAKMIDKIVSLKDPKTFEINGDTYCDSTLVRVVPHVDSPWALEVTGLDSICKLIREEMEKVESTIMVQVKDYNLVECFTTYRDNFARFDLYRCRADVPGFRSGWREREEALIQLRSLFIPNEGTEYLLNLLSRISEDSNVTSSDNGVTQRVEARQGIALNSMVEVKPRVSLQPFRTFLEVAQPESEFLLRVDKDRGIGFFEADGGVWKLEAKRNVVAYFNEALKDLIEDGKVVVMM